MVRIVFAPQALDDLERLTDFLIENDKSAALLTIELIEEAVKILARHPLLGRLCDIHLRELVISRGKSGYIALYSFEESKNMILINAIRHQKESGGIY
ncbi:MULTISPECIES: type II toxin-antitoxin system RelE/ParE family toxin [unclassified Polynucleobacter]|uniref:type II toxin-antitoxin system RelE/ParE family toxin n=1 Tax=unclassified Polynucleobacter TaxID=2640945 RepID=UPI000BD0330B|nr:MULTISPECIES: type II toxin-antitoxin system RelE/ParE family toxin [unclassified Polynucleobacter]OYY21004.1 MAG: addiction module toxin RelE [Polynucleobacter sp. 35-46-11]OZA77741.1 MAG: addiction module toxin RelE [Polynucleobacter sp. 39-46-10]